ncbi:hypothetical protein GCM10007338_04340 [Corynebacterium pelargi]|nr:hypothetical protein GCM10007338_04340 [Corynebacterium pelargi]
MQALTVRGYMLWIVTDVGGQVKRGVGLKRDPARFGAKYLADGAVVSSAHALAKEVRNVDIVFIAAVVAIVVAIATFFAVGKQTRT